MCRVCSIRFQNDLMLMLCVIIYLVFIVVLVVLIVIKVMACTSHSKTQMFKYVSYKKNRWMNFWVTQMSHGGWRYVYILKWTATTQYEEIPFFLSSLYTVLHVRFEFRHISFPPTHQLAIGVDFDVWTTIASVCRLNCKFPESLGIFNWNLSRISNFPFGLSRFVNHKKTRPHWFGRKLSQTEKENRTDTPYSSANIFVYKL